MCNLYLDCADIRRPLANLDIKPLAIYSNRSRERSSRRERCRMVEKCSLIWKFAKMRLDLGLKPAKTEVVKARRVLGCLTIGEFWREYLLQLLLLHFVLQAFNMT